MGKRNQNCSLSPLSMQSSSSTSSWPLDYVPPSADHLLNCRIDDPQVNVDDGLCSPGDQKIFLTASMTFLQQHLMQKLGKENCPHTVNAPSTEKLYSDLLMIETCSKSIRRKYFIRLKNTEQYNEVLRQEARTPLRSILSLEQLLPMPRKDPKQNKTGIMSFFRAAASTSDDPRTEKRKLGNIFRKMSSRHKLDEAKAICSKDRSTMDLSRLKEVRCQLYVDLLPNPSAMLPVPSNLRLNHNPSNMTSLALNRIQMAPTFSKPFCAPSSNSNPPACVIPETNYGKNHVNARKSKPIREKKKPELTRKDLEVLHFLSGVQSRTVMNSSIPALDDTNASSGLERGDFDLGSKSKESTNLETSKVNLLTRSIARTMLKQQSKLSVCIEDESDSEDEEFRSCLRMLNYSFRDCTNFTDEVKSKFSSEYVPIVVKRV